MLIIRLQRTGTKNKPQFRIVLAQSFRSVSKQVLEVLGHYTPRSKAFGIKDQERLKYWLSQNVAMSPTVKNLLIEQKILTGKKIKAWQPKKSAEGGSSSGGKAVVEGQAATPRPSETGEARPSEAGAAAAETAPVAV